MTARAHLWCGELLEKERQQQFVLVLQDDRVLRREAGGTRNVPNQQQKTRELSRPSNKVDRAGLLTQQQQQQQVMLGAAVLRMTYGAAPGAR